MGEDGEILLEVSFWRSAEVDQGEMDVEGDHRITCAKREDDDWRQGHCTNTRVREDDGDILIPWEVWGKGCFWLVGEEHDCFLLPEVERGVTGVEDVLA